MKAEKKTIFRLVEAAAAAVLLTALIVSCGDDPVSAEPEDVIDLAGTSWKLTAVESVSDTLFDGYENGTWQVPDEDQYLVEFTADSSVFAYIYCQQCPEGEGSSFTVTGDSLSVSLACEAGYECGKNDAFTGRIQAVETYDYDDETLQLHYTLAEGEQEQRGTLHFTKIEDARPEAIPYEVLRQHWQVSTCWLNTQQVEFDDDKKDFSSFERIIDNEEDFEKYISCQEETSINLDEFFLLVGMSKKHKKCVWIPGQQAYLIGDIIYYSVEVATADCDFPERAQYIIKLPVEFQANQIEFRVFWRNLFGRK